MKIVSNLAKIEIAQRTDVGTVTFNFENGSKMVTNLSKELLSQPADRVLEILNTTCSDLGALNFEI